MHDKCNVMLAHGAVTPYSGNRPIKEIGVTRVHSKPLTALGSKKMRLVVRLVPLEGIGGILDSAEYLPRIWDWLQVWQLHLLGYLL
ncbi:MAG: hypothetical protein HOM44_13985 [Gammaproteobacteria bacterium]|nr:hypothetical protein [Gammaproteobacteria bacterium]